MVIYPLIIYRCSVIWCCRYYDLCCYVKVWHTHTPENYHKRNFE